MRTLSFRRLAVVMGVGFVLAAGVYGLHRFQRVRSAGVFLRLAEQAAEAKNLQKAVRDYSLYLRLVRDDVDVMARQAMLLADLERLPKAFLAFERVLRLDPERTDVRRRLTQVAMAMGRYPDAADHLQNFLLKESPEDGELLDWLGRCQELSGQFQEAAVSYRAAIQRAPGQLETYARLAALTRHRLDRPQEADPWLDKMVEANPQSARAYVLRGRYHKERRNADKAAQDAQRAVGLAPDDPEALCLAAQCELQQGKTAAALAHARHGVDKAPWHDELYVTLADIEIRSAHRAEAIKWLERGADAVPKPAGILGNLANLLLDENRLQDAQAVVERLQALEEARPLANYLEARVEFGQGNWLAASKKLEQARPVLAAWPDVVKQIDYWLGECYGRLGNADLQLAAYRRAVGSDAQWARARLGVASALLAVDRIDEALAEFRQIMASPGAPVQGWLYLAQLSILKNLQLNPQSRDWKEIERFLGEAARVEPNSTRVHVLRAECLVLQDRLPDAEKALRDAATRMPKEVDLRLALAALAERQAKWDEAERTLKETEAQFGDGVALRLARAQQLVRRHGNKAAAQLLGLAGRTDKFSEAETIQLWRGLVTSFLRIGELKQARQLCQRLAEKEPNSLQVRLLLFDLAVMAEDHPAVAQVLEDVQRIEGSGPLWHYGSAAYLRMTAKNTDKEQLDQAREHLAAAGLMRPAWSRVPALLAEVCELEDRVDEAIQHYLQAVERGERNTAVVRRAVQLLYRRQRYIDADRLIRRLEQQDAPFSSDLGRMATELSLRLDDFDRALEVARKTARQSKDSRDHIWLGQILSVLGQRAGAERRSADAQNMLQEAEKEFRAAVAIDEKAPDAWVALIQFLGRAQRAPQAEQVIAEAQRKLPPAQAPLALAQCYEALGRADEADRKYAVALAAAGDNPKLIQTVADYYLRTGKTQLAEKEFGRLLGGQIQLADSDAAACRRNLGLLLCSRGGYANLQRALRLIEENLAAAPASPLDQRAKALVLASYPDRAHRREAIQSWEALPKDPQAVAPEDRFILAGLYRAENDTAAAARELRGLAVARANEPRYVAAYVATLLQRKELSEAELWLRELDRLAPKDAATVRLQAELLFQRNRAADALKTLRDSLVPPAAAPKDREARARAVAAQLEDFGQRLVATNQANAAAPFLQEAEKLLRDYVGQQPDQSLLVAQFLARQRRYDEALKMAEAAWQKADVDAIAAAAAAVAGSGAVDGKQLARIERLVSAALARHNRSPVLLRVMAMVHTRGERYPEAEAVYREILKSTESDVVALNNLALLLALQRRQLDEAQQMVDRAIAAAGRIGSLLDTRACVLLAQGKPQQALSDLTEAVGDAPQAADFQFHLAQAQFNLGQKQEAADSLQNARKLGLDANRLHPLEQHAYRTFQEALK